MANGFVLSVVKFHLMTYARIAVDVRIFLDLTVRIEVRSGWSPIMILWPRPVSSKKWLKSYPP